jgi:UDP-N-acetylmuramoylalanine-D-glutamate ligase
MAFRGCKNLKDVYAGRKVMPLIMDHLDWYGIHPNYHELT